MNTKVIDLKDYFAECVRKIWIIAICIVVFIGIMTIYSKNSDKNTNSKTKVSTYEEIEQSLTTKEWDDINTYITYLDLQQQKQKYVDESIYMKINPYEVSSTCIQYCVSPADSTMDMEKDLQATTVAYNLYNHIKRGGIAKYLQENYDESIDLEYYQELIALEEYKDGMITYSIYHPEMEDSKKIAELSLKSLQEETEKLKNEGYVFESKLVSQNSGVIAQDSIRAYQDNVRSGLTANKSSVEGRWENMTEAQKVVTSSKLGKKYVAKELVVVNTLKKFIIIGVVVGILCGMVIVFVLYYGSSKIKVCEETELTDKIENLGSEINPKQNIFEGIANKIFYSKRNREIKKKINVAKIKSLCQKKNVKEIGVIGIKEEQIKSYYISELDKNNIRMICVDDINSVENIECISGVDTVMFFEYLKETDYATVEKIVKFCNHRGIDILGYISVVK